MYRVFLGLGSNLGDRLGSLSKATQTIEQAMPVRAISSVYETEPVGMEPGHQFYNMALEVQTEYVRSAYESFVAESQKIAGLYTDLAKQTFKPIEGMVAKFAPPASR